MSTQNFFSSGTSTTRVDYAALILRVVGGAAMVYGHGWSKFNKFLGESNIEFMDPFGIGHGATFFLVVFAEFICALLLTIGLFTRLAAIPLVLNMAYIAFFVHISDEFGKLELPSMYLAMYLAVLLLGPGKFSLDRMIGKRKKTI
ncbi:MAG: DoxX family protein [Weeksellaceae bacterium]